MSEEIEPLKEEKNKKKFKNFLPAILMGVVVVITGAVGGVGGWFLGNYFKPSVKVVGGFTKDESVYNTYQEYLKSNGGDITSIDLSNQNVLSPADIINVAFYNISYIEENATVVSYCEAVSKAAFVTNVQGTYSCSAKRGNLYLREAASSATYVSFAERTYNYDESKGKLGSVYDDKYDYYRVIGSSNVNIHDTDVNLNYDNATYTEYTVDEFSEDFSISPLYFTTYKIKAETEAKDDSGNYISMSFSNSLTNSDVEFTTSISKNGEGNYEVSLLLNEKAVEDSQKYYTTTTRDQSQIAKMKDVPTWHYSAFKFVLDSTLRFVSGSWMDSYDCITVAGAAPTIVSGIYEFDYENKDALPGLGTMVDYSSLKEVFEYEN